MKDRKFKSLPPRAASHTELGSGPISMLVPVVLHPAYPVPSQGLTRLLTALNTSAVLATTKTDCIWSRWLLQVHICEMFVVLGENEI